MPIPSPKRLLARVLFLLGVSLPHLWLAAPLKAQNALSLSQSVLAFGNRTETSNDTLGFTVTNTDTANILCRARCLPYYGHLPFRTNDTLFGLAPGQSKRVVVSFKPRHNTWNNTELLLSHNGKGGTLRVDLTGQGVFSLAYYTSTQNLEGESLRAALAQRVSSPYTSLGYSGTNNGRLRMFGVIDNWKVNGREPAHANPYKNECVYSGRTISYTATDFNTGTLNNAPYSMNTEHTWPQSFMGSAEPMQSDLHHLFTTDGGINSARGNKPFGWVPNPTLTYTGGSKANSIWFEPRDAHKGPVARAVLYFALRHAANSQVNLSFLDTAQQRMLREWVNLYPSDSIAIRRNNDVQAAQSNRNPLVDYPQFLERMTTVLPPSQSPTWRSVTISDSVLNWGLVPVGTALPRSCWVCNSGNVVLQVQSIQISGGGFGFSGGGATTSPFSVNAGECAELRLFNSSTQAAGTTATGTLSLATQYSGQNSTVHQIALSSTTSNPPVVGGQMAGTLRYDNSTSSPLVGVTVRAIDSIGQNAGQSLCGSQGDWSIQGLVPGNYTLEILNPPTWQGINGTDALLINRHFAALQPLSGLKVDAGDPNRSGSINSTDALQVTRRFANLVSSFGRGDWVYSALTATATIGVGQPLNIKALCTGDVNASRAF